MIYAVILFVLFSFVSYRLIGGTASKGKVFVSSIASLAFSSGIYYLFHLKGRPVQEGFIEFNHFTFLYFITLVIVSMSFTLLLEMVSNQEEEWEDDLSLNPIEKVSLFFKTKFRYVNLLWITARNGLLKSTLHTNKDQRHLEAAKALRNTLEHAGGMFIKFGQFLSTRTDLFSKPFIEELTELQENVRRVPTEQIKSLITEQLERPVEEIFESFDDEPLAAASIGQVHRARLKNGQEVVVKVLRPNLKNQVKVDITILRNFAKLLARKTTWARQTGIVELTEGFIQNLFEELDLSLELKNLQQMRKVRGENVYIPKAYEHYSTSGILVTEFVEGVSIHRICEIEKTMKIDRQEITASLYAEILDQIFTKGVFHSDPHPGNIYILKNGQPALIDFGSVGRLSAIQQNGFKWLLIGISKKNAESMVTGIKKLIENSEEINTKKLEQSLSQFLVEHTFDGDVMEEMGTDLFAIMNRYGLKFYPDVAGAFRSLITMQGSLQAINPEFSLASIMNQYVKDQLTMKNLREVIIGNLEDDVLNAIPKVKTFPKRMDNLLGNIENGDLKFNVSFFADEDNVRFINGVLSLFFTGLVGLSFGLLSLGALFLAQTDIAEGYSFLDVFGYSGLGLSVIMLIRVSIQSMKRKQ